MAASTAELVGSVKLGLRNSLEIVAECWVKVSLIENETLRRAAALGLGSNGDWPKDQCGARGSVLRAVSDIMLSIG